VSSDDETAESAGRGQFYVLYLTRFAAGFGFTALLTLLPDFIGALDPSGLELGLFVTGLTLAQSVAVIPIAHWGDTGDKRRVLLASLVVSVAAYVAFLFVDTATHFILARGLQGLAITGTGLMSLSLVGELAPADERANHIGKANAWRFAAAIVGGGSAAVVFELFGGASGGGFDAVFTVLILVLLPAMVGVWAFLDPDESRLDGFAFDDLALNRRIITLTSFRAPYAVAVTLVRTWAPIYAGIAVADGGLGASAIAVSAVISVEKLTNMLCQPYTGRLSDRFGRASFVAAGGFAYGLVALAVPFTPGIASALGVPSTYPLGTVLPIGAGAVPLVDSLPATVAVAPALFPLLALNGLLGVADSLREPASMALFADEGTDEGGVASSFGIRELVWRPGSVGAPILGGVLTRGVGIDYVFFSGGAAAVVGVGLFLAVGANFFGVESFGDW